MSIHKSQCDPSDCGTNYEYFPLPFFSFRPNHAFELVRNLDSTSTLCALRICTINAGRESLVDAVLVAVVL